MTLTEYIARLEAKIAELKASGRHEHVQQAGGINLALQWAREIHTSDGYMMLMVEKIIALKNAPVADRIKSKEEFMEWLNTLKKNGDESEVINDK